ncbi:nucleotide exchange factor GrpE [Terribacillus saccharophilus]|uniref:nucleotide exchange factor GrpE n=1 Tax=Terribacillus saccharophilus TaxID=361277 RepID=UPI000BA781FE|nr:nucleotide exchange factor GrpE [Terribacillus saccharophilus]PAF21895.1 nucleotide exchange factor GrpE [Terribacillus saccharophilus]PAF38893.1 nucleotide exchange factor GrpE [Terribacillus saccharophilus]PAF40948.1 nucleotide exchange factor GrpE [Terribacillus saccharophilus]
MANEEKEKVNETEEQEAVEAEVIDAAPAEESETNNEGSERLAQLEQEKNEMYDRLLRLQAEYDNFRKRTQKEKEAASKYRSQDLAEALLPVVDNLDRALQTVQDEEANKGFVDGIRMVHRQLLDAFDNQGIETIETVGQTFDPHLHQAVMQVENDEYEPNTVVQELQKGYKLKDRVIRPAMVQVNQ